MVKNSVWKFLKDEQGKFLEGIFTDSGNQMKYELRAQFIDNDGVILSISKEYEGKKESMFTETFYPKVDQNDLLTLTSFGKRWIKGIEYSFNEDEHINKRLSILISDSMINVLIDSLRDEELEYIGGYNTKFENPSENLVCALSTIENSHNKKRVIHTKSLIEMLRDLEVYPIPSTPIDGRLFSVLSERANKDFEIIEDIRELNKDFLERNLENKRRENAEMYKVRDEHGNIQEISAFMVYSIREVD